MGRGFLCTLSLKQACNRARTARTARCRAALHRSWGFRTRGARVARSWVRRSILLLGASPSSQANFAGRESVLFLFIIIFDWSCETGARRRTCLQVCFLLVAGGPPTARAAPVAGRRAPSLHPMTHPSATRRSLALHVYKWFSFQSRRSKLGAPRGTVVRLEKARKRGQATEAGLPPTRADAGLGNEGGGVRGRGAPEKGLPLIGTQ